MTDNTLSAQEIRAVRLANGISQEDFAEYIEIPKSTYSKWEFHGTMYADVRAKATNALTELGADFDLRRENANKFERAQGKGKSRKRRNEYARAQRKSYESEEHTPSQGVPQTPPTEEPDSVNRPDHYHKGGIDVLEYAERKLPRDQNIGFYRINVLKYVTRYDSKNGLEDLMKAQYYLDKLIKAEQQEE